MAKAPKVPAEKQFTFRKPVDAGKRIKKADQDTYLHPNAMRAARRLDRDLDIG
jgi:hypothetical protein